jgi:hypothetical protein
VTRRFVIAGAVALVLGQMQPSAQTRPDFGGTWVLTTGAGWCNKSLIATQDATTLTLDSGEVPASTRDAVPRTASRLQAIRFDGADTRQAFPPAPPRPADATATTWIATTVASVARAAWNGDRLVVVTHYTMKMTWPSQMPGEFERENTFRETFALDADGRLVIEKVAVIDPLPGGTTARLDFPTSWTCTYKKKTR